ncbi:cytochrome P450 [Arthrobacter sp. H35-D1]|uniref:cytochrome P450 n=1 Tax=Arthrobacter sp. H35-D1 TaxID=3046202 RepID=UPI0024BA54B6|nr:cytochrome P450 [Arthrobacter sp. H35-D1]MDJ0314830.1 cytochrome P450 [Arthrobacter sp. H35-D1]
MNYHVVKTPALAREVMRRTDDFAPTNALTSVVPLAPATLRILSKAKFALPPVLASATGEQHRAVRTVVTRFFTPAKVAAVTPRVQEIARTHLAHTAAALEQGPVDLARSVAMHVPPVVMAELTGQANPPLEALKTWSRDSLELFWGWPDEARQLELAHSAAAFYGWLREEVAASRGSDSLFGVLLTAGLSSAEVCSLGYFLVIAGQETTSQLINTALYRGIGSGVGSGAKSPEAGSPEAGSSGAGHRLAQRSALHPWAALADPAAAAQHVRGVLASESSVHTWRRAALRDTVLDGVQLPAGAEVLLQLSGNHGPQAPPTAYSLAFGHGLHRCLGAKLAELETTLVVQETARALPYLALAGPEPEWLRLLSFQTPMSVLVECSTP